MKPILQFAGILAVGALIIIGTTYVTNSLKKPEVIQTAVTVVAQSPQCPNDFSSYQSLVNSGQSVELVKNLNTYAANGNFINDKTIAVTRSGSDQVACGYLYVRAGIDGHPLDLTYDSIYISPQGLGGQILRSKTIAITNPVASTTEVLLPLNAITYLPSLPYNPNAQNYQIVNWSDLLNAANTITFHIGLSTLSPNAVINEIIIAYKCWNPSTGQETNNCQLSVQ